MNQGYEFLGHYIRRKSSKFTLDKLRIAPNSAISSKGVVGFESLPWRSSLVAGDCDLPQ